MTHQERALAGHPARDRAAHERTRAGRRTAGLCVVLLATSAAVLTAFGLLDGGPHGVTLAWWVLALIAALGLMTEFDVEFRREVVTFTFSEVLLVLGLFLASPVSLLVGRVVGETLVFALKERQPARKTAVNLASSIAEITTLLLVHELLGGGTDVTEPAHWLIALVAVACADLVGYAAMCLALRWHGAPITFRSLLGIAIITVPVNTSFALVIGILLVEEPVGTFLLLGVGGCLVLSYRSYTALRQRFQSLSLLYDFTRLVSGAQRPDAVLEAMLAQAKDLLRAERAEIWLQEETMLRLCVDDHGRSAGEVPELPPGTVADWFGVHTGATIVGTSQKNAAAGWTSRRTGGPGARDRVGRSRLHRRPDHRVGAGGRPRGRRQPPRRGQRVQRLRSHDVRDAREPCERRPRERSADRSTARRGEAPGARGTPRRADRSPQPGAPR